MHNLGKGLGPFAAVVFALIASTGGARAEDKPCDKTSVRSCACDLTQLRPLQGAVGEQEVKKKAEEIADDPKDARSSLESDPIKVILYGGHLYIVDHHHGAKAWIESADNAIIKKEKWIENSVCEVMNKTYGLPFDYASEDNFWKALQDPASSHVWLENEKGQKITPDKLPKTVAVLPDDPYRTFARKVEKEGGFCKFPGSGDFLEFMWADAAFRNNAKFQNVDLMKKSVVREGVDEARKPKYKCAVPVGLLMAVARCRRRVRPTRSAGRLARTPFKGSVTMSCWRVGTSGTRIPLASATCPGVGQLTALAFVAAIDDPSRIRRSRDVGAYLGLVPRRYQSGEVDYTGGISKCGDRRVRTLLYEAANVMLTRYKGQLKLKDWAFAIAKRSTMRKARVALARRLAIIMHAMLRDGTEFASA